WFNRRGEAFCSGRTDLHQRGRGGCASIGHRCQASAHRFLHERADPGLFGGSQLLQREGDRPQGAFVEVRGVAEAERRVPRFELLRGLEMADDLAVLGVRGHPVPGSRREGWRAGFDCRLSKFFTHPDGWLPYFRTLVPDSEEKEFVGISRRMPSAGRRRCPARLASPGGIVPLWCSSGRSSVCPSPSDASPRLYILTG